MDFENTLEENALDGIEMLSKIQLKTTLKSLVKNILHGNCNLKIYNMLGEIVLSQDYSSFGNKQNVNLEKLKAGSYIIEFVNNQATNKQKLIIE